MEKEVYEKIKALRKSVADGTATFKQRNILRIIEKRRKKGQQVH